MKAIDKVGWLAEAVYSGGKKRGLRKCDGFQMGRPGAVLAE